jgi:hypothetical protein
MHHDISFKKQDPILLAIYITLVNIILFITFLYIKIPLSIFIEKYRRKLKNISQGKKKGLFYLGKWHNRFLFANGAWYE